MALNLFGIQSSSLLADSADAAAGSEERGCDSLRDSKFLVIGHRGCGMNKLQSAETRLNVFKENSIRSFNAAAKFAVDFVEFDVQVTKDGCPIIFHDNFILCEENGTLVEKRVVELSLSEFLSYGPQPDSTEGKKLMRKGKGGNIQNWEVEKDDCLCTLEECLEKVDPSIGFNLEIKLDDDVVYNETFLLPLLLSILQVVSEFANERPIFFSSFQPDAAILMRKLQCQYPVFFLTDGKNEEMHSDKRRNSIEAAVDLCFENGLQGLVAEVGAVFLEPDVVIKAKDCDLSLLTYGQLNNVVEMVYIQYTMGVDGVIVDFVEEITGAIATCLMPQLHGYAEEKSRLSPVFFEHDRSFVVRLISELIQFHKGCK